MRVINSIVNTTSQDNESYVVLPVLKRMCAHNDINVSQNKRELINSILALAERPEKYNDVRDFFERSIKQGSKHVKLRKIMVPDPSVDYVEVLSQILPRTMFTFFTDYNIALGYNIVPGIKLMNYSFVYNENCVKKIQLVFNAHLFELVNRADGVFDRISYPLHVDIDVEQREMVVRAKNKTNLYLAIPYDEDVKTSVTPNALMDSTFNYCVTLFRFELCSLDDSTRYFRNILGRMLDALTQTPEEIEAKITNYSGWIENSAQLIYEQESILYCADAPMGGYKMALDDLKILVEKHISINYEDTSIFTQGKPAYPVRISIRDAELSTVNERSSEIDPIQTKAVFFDNKRSSNIEKACTAMSLCFQRIARTYYTTSHYLVALSTVSGFCVGEFPHYVDEEDIAYVFSTFRSYSED